MNRHDWEKLTERPVVEERLENGKVADVLVAERSLELFDFVRHITQSAMHVDDLLRELPVKRIDLRLRFELEMTEGECFLRLFFDLLNIVQTLHAIAALQSLFHIDNVADEFVVLFTSFDF